MWTYVRVLIIFGTLVTCITIISDDYDVFKKFEEHKTEECGLGKACRLDRLKDTMFGNLSTLPSGVVKNVYSAVRGEERPANFVDLFFNRIRKRSLIARYGERILILDDVLRMFFNTSIAQHYSILYEGQTLELAAGSLLQSLRREYGVSDENTGTFWSSVVNIFRYGKDNVARVLGNHTEYSAGGCDPVYEPPAERVVNGQVTRKGQYKFLATLQRYGSAVCAATVIGTRHVLTAAHCVKGASARELSVNVAEYDLYTADGEKLVQVSRVFIHPRFGERRPNNDIAVLVLAQSVKGVPNSRPVCFPTRNQCKRLKNRRCTVVGWGAIKYQQGKLVFPRYPRDAVVRAYDGTICPNKRPAPSLPSRQLCAVGKSDTCNGDSGSPLLCRYGGRWIQCGVTSYGPEVCNKPGTNGVYTSIRPYLPWIRSVMRK